MYAETYRAWFRAGIDGWLLAGEAAAVVGLRSARLVSGSDAGAREAALMVTEKVAAALELQAALVGAGPWLTPLSGAQEALRHYRRKVAANRRRLSR